MNAMPVINPATVIGVFHNKVTELLSKKKNVVAASVPIEIIQNVTPTKSSESNKSVSAFAALDKPIKIEKARPKIFSLFIKNFFLFVYYYILNLKYNYNNLVTEIDCTLAK